jgi:SAM-dependent methyltransferase
MRMTWQVVSFNRHFFGIALATIAAGVAAVLLVTNPVVRILLGLGIGLAAYFMVVSVLASYWIYDASDLYRLRRWPERCLPHDPCDGIVVHAGFDPASPLVRQRYSHMRLRVLDFFDADTTTEESIRRAHRLWSPPQPQEQIVFDSWPVDTASQDAVFILNAAHELRDPDQRAAFFREARRVLRPGGRIVVIEQVRNAANFACFGPAAFHFLSRRTWVRTFAAAGLTVADEFPITPFVRAFVLQDCTAALPNTTAPSVSSILATGSLPQAHP